MTKSLVFPQTFPLSKERLNYRTPDLTNLDASDKINPELLSLWRKAYPNIIKILGSPTEHDVLPENEADELGGVLLR